MKGIRIRYLLAVLVALLALSGCGRVTAPLGKPTPQTGSQGVTAMPAPTAVSIPKGAVVDSTGKCDAKYLAAHGIAVIRYIGPEGGSWKQMTGSEYAAYRAAYKAKGLNPDTYVGFAEEGSVSWMDGGYAAGAKAMSGGLAWVKAHGGPKYPVIFLARDVEMNTTAIARCLDGAASVSPLGKAQVGLYAGIAVVNYNLPGPGVPATLTASPSFMAQLDTVAKNHAGRYWQTDAWSGSKTSPKTDLQQHVRWGQHWGPIGSDYDENIAIDPDWNIPAGTKPAPLPAPKPKPAPGPKRVYVVLKRTIQKVRDGHVITWHRGGRLLYLKRRVLAGRVQYLCASGGHEFWVRNVDVRWAR